MTVCSIPEFIAIVMPKTAVHETSYQNFLSLEFGYSGGIHVVAYSLYFYDRTNAIFRKSCVSSSGFCNTTPVGLVPPVPPLLAGKTDQAMDSVFFSEVVLHLSRVNLNLI
jgi:hypothetical protein